MSYKRRSDYKPPRERREITHAVLASLAVILATTALVWFLRPNRDSGSSTPAVTSPPTSAVTTVPGATTSLPGTTTAPTSTAPATAPTTSKP